MRSKAFLLILVFALAVCGAFAYSLLAETNAEIDIPFQKFALPNGLTLMVHEDHKAPIIAVNVWYHIGSKNEKPGADPPRLARNARRSGSVDPRPGPIWLAR